MLLIVSQRRSPTRPGYRELDLELVLLEEHLSHHPKQDPMAYKKRYEKEKDTFKIFVEEFLLRQRN
jgi:hypothetical protein